MPDTGWSLSADELSIFGQGLHRPECVLVDHDGIWVSDARGGVSRLDEAGVPHLLGSGIVETNGFSRRPDGSFVAAGLGDCTLHHILPDGTTTRLLDSLDGVPLGTVNCACADGPERVWLSVMTRSPTWVDGFRSGKADGYIVRVDGSGAKIVADGLFITNEVRLSPDGQHLYVAESAARRIVRFPLRPDGTLGARETVGPEDFGRGAFIDGFGFDAAGNIWVTVITRNGLSVITPEGDYIVVYEDVKVDALDAFISAAEAGSATAELMVACLGDGPMKMPTSIAFTGSSGEIGLVGSLAAPYLIRFKVPPAARTL
jgi:gluconolactonase